MPSNPVNVCFNGCSFTVGEGFSIEDRKQYNYDALLTTQFGYAGTNLAVCGNSNYKIFLSSAQALLENKYKIVFTQWSMLNRIWFAPGPDSTFFVNDGKTDFRYRDLYLNQTKKKILSDALLLLNHDYQNILDLIDYCNILAQLAKNAKTQIVFINGIVPWSDDLITCDHGNLNNALSDYTKSILDFDHRDDSEILEFHQKLQTKFLSLDQSLWVNLFESFQDNTTDLAPDGYHPGINSNIWMAERISKYLLDQ